MLTFRSQSRLHQFNNYNHIHQSLTCTAPRFLLFLSSSPRTSVTKIFRRRAMTWFGFLLFTLRATSVHTPGARAWATAAGAALSKQSAHTQMKIFWFWILSPPGWRARGHARIHNTASVYNMYVEKRNSIKARETCAAALVILMQHMKNNTVLMPSEGGCVPLDREIKSVVISRMSSLL